MTCRLYLKTWHCYIICIWHVVLFRVSDRDNYSPNYQVLEHFRAILMQYDSLAITPHQTITLHSNFINLPHYLQSPYPYLPPTTVYPLGDNSVLIKPALSTRAYIVQCWVHTHDILMPWYWVMCSGRPNNILTQLT